MNDTHKGNASSCQDQAAAVCGSTRRLWQWMTLTNRQPPHYFAVLLLGPAAAAAAVCLTAARVAHQPPTASSASRRASETVFSSRCWPVDSKNLELPWKKPRSSASPPTEKKKKNSLPVRLTPTFLNCISLCLPVCLSVVRKLCCKTRTFSSLLTVFLSLCATAVDLLSEMLVCVPQLTFFQLLAPQAFVRSLLLINFVLLFFVVWTSCCNSRCQSQGNGSIYNIYTSEFFLRVLHNTWRKLGRFGGW